MSFARYFAIVRQQWKAVVAGALVGLLAAVGFLVVGGQTYTAQTDLNINVISTDPFNAQRSASGLLDATTEAQLATSYVVARIAAKELDVDPIELRRATDAVVVPDATVIRVRYTADSEAAAIAGADAVAAAYLSYRSEQAEERLRGILARTNERIEALRSSLADANQRVAAEPAGSSAQAEAVSDRDLLTIELNNLLSLKTQTEAIDTAGGSTLTLAVENEVVAAPGRALTLATGLAVGLVVGILAAFVLAFARRRVTGVEDVLAETGQPVLGSLRATRAAVPAQGADRDQIRTVRERLLNQVDPRGRTLLVVDDTGAGSDVPVNLALALAESGVETRLVLPGLPADAVAALRSELRIAGPKGKAAGARTLTSSRHPRLQVVVPPVDGSGEVLGAEVRRVLAEPREDAATLLVLPPGRDEASLISGVRGSQAVVGLVEAGVTPRARVEALTAAAWEAGADHLGTVIVRGGRRVDRPAPGTGAARAKGAADVD